MDDTPEFTLADAERQINAILQRLEHETGCRVLALKIEHQASGLQLGSAGYGTKRERRTACIELSADGVPGWAV